ncbi:unnamed protein product [Polarella glacialis]|uniref:Uncharacterized protein n=1 Tax=Polarella glacialis TaxID=89957 RepID=A0A813FC09_POLGL|nr:unnamed protein product [Polarella glacialis]
MAVTTACDDRCRCLRRLFSFILCPCLTWAVSGWAAASRPRSWSPSQLLRDAFLAFCKLRNGVLVAGCLLRSRYELADQGFAAVKTFDFSAGAPQAKIADTLLGCFQELLFNRFVSEIFFWHSQRCQCLCRLEST